MDRPSIFGSAEKSSLSVSSSLRKRRMRPTKSATSSSAKALSSDSIGTACRTMATPRGGAGLVGDLGAGEHARNLLAPRLGGDLGDARCDALALVERILRDDVVTLRLRRDLRRVRHGEHLHAAAQADADFRKAAEALS